MKKHSITILQDFDNDKFLYQEFGEVIQTLIKSLLNSGNLRPHQVSFRTKDRESLSNKLVRKNNKYKSIKEITDIVGLRIVTYFENDIDVISDVFKKEFEIDYPNSVDKRQVEADKFGYRSLHYVASLNKTRLTLTEYKKFKNYKFEVQIRSILQHSWAEIEHDLGYKGESEIPETAKRTFYRVAALLEQADIEFVKLRKEISVHEEHIKEQIISNSDTVKINKSSLIAFIKESKAVNELENILDSVICRRGNVSEASYIADGVIPKLGLLKITSLKQLEELLTSKKETLIEFIKKDYFLLPEPRPETFVAGASIHWLIELLESKSS